jgi:nucleotide-binding universal stress UspA family protein
MKILACLDFSDQAQYVLERSVEVAKREKADLILFTVAEDLVDYGEGVMLNISEQINQQAKDLLDGMSAKAKALGVSPRAVLDQGTSPAGSILTFAEREGVDLIVVGSKAKSGIDRFLIGSVASKVVNHSRCSVLVLR